MSLDALEGFFGGRVVERRIQAELQAEAWPESRDLERAHFRAMRAIQAQLDSLCERDGRCFYADHLVAMEQEARHHRDLTDTICRLLRYELNMSREEPAVVPTTDELPEMLDTDIKLENQVRIMLSLRLLWGSSSDFEQKKIDGLLRARATVAQKMGVGLTGQFAKEIRARKLLELKIVEIQAQGLRLEVEDLERLTGASQLQCREHQDKVVWALKRRGQNHLFSIHRVVHARMLAGGTV